MQTHLKRLKRTKPSDASAPPAAKKSWAEQHAPIATIIAAYSTLAAVIIAGLGYYFTVIPLYQKAAVDELIAKREIELKEAQAAIILARRQAYEQQRENFVRRIEFPAVDCSDILASITQPSVDFEDKAAIRAGRERQIRLDVEVSACLQSVLTKYDAVKVLTQTDLLHITRSLNVLGTKLDLERSEAKAQIADVPSLAKRNPSALEPLGPLFKRGDEFYEEWRKKLFDLGVKLPDPERRREERLQHQIGMTQAKIATDYRMSASQAIRNAIRTIQWPKEASSLLGVN